jgi:hypothetical protein
MQQLWHDLVTTPESSEKIGHESPIITMGSCFADEVGKRLQNCKFDVLNNPAGTIYNPVSMEAVWLYVSGQLHWNPEQAYQREGIWFSWDHHSSIHGKTIEELEANISLCHDSLSNALQKSSWLFLTLGSAWTYIRKESGMVVANCHKAPGTFFEKRLLTIEQSSESLRNIISIIKRMNSDCHILLTLSPVRHKRDGFHENQLSKATLLLAMKDVIESNAHIHYFPSYEIALDELRDYRFYAIDRCHLTMEATDYIFHRFEKAFMSAETLEINESCRQIARDMAHRPIINAEKSIAQHRQRILDNINRVVNKRPFLDFEAEIEMIQKGI